MAVTDSKVALNATVTIGSGGTSALGSVISAQVPEREIDSVETSVMNTNGDRSFLPGARDPGKFAIKINFTQQEAGELETLIGVSGTSFVVTFWTSGSHYDWTGFITKAVVDEVQFGDKITISIEGQAQTWATYTAGT